MQKSAGEIVQRGGIYNIRHLAHRPQHQAILGQGELFPFCESCGNSVTFEYVRPMTDWEELEHIGYDHDFMRAVLALAS